MYSSRAKFKIFAEMDVQQYLQNNDRNIVSEIEQEPEDYILNVNELEYVSHLVSKFNIDNLSLDFESVSVDSYEKLIPAQWFPRTYHFADPGRSYPKLVFVYHIPYSGGEELLRCAPSVWISGTEEVFIQDQCVCFEVLSFSEDTEEITREKNNILNNIKVQFETLSGVVAHYNANLRDRIEQMFRARKQRYLEKNKKLASLGVPIKKKADLPQTFTIPPPQMRRKITIRPTVTEVGYQPEPALDQTTYQDILKTIHDVGKEFERLPSTYSGKSEEALRDHLLLFLQPQFEGSATGETFNKSGKTDILLRYKNFNVFIAECKLWDGKQLYLDTITQLIGYLTWRDSKAAVVMFVRNKDLSSVLKTVEEVTPKHSDFLGFVDKKEDSWFNYRFHIRDDPNREVKLAVLLFHIPS